MSPVVSSSTETATAKLLLELGTVTLRPDEPFRYSSGILSPIYIDNHVFLSHLGARKKIAKAMQDVIEEKYRHLDAVAGTATAGIAWAAWMTAEFNVPMAYVRDRARRTGQKNQIEGVVEPSSRVLVVDDLITTGRSSLGTVQALRRAGATPLAVVTIFNYQTETATKAFGKARVPLHALTTFKTLVEVAVRMGKLTEESHEQVLQWAADPPNWGNRMGFE